jgi:hypothetical protein
MFVFIAGECWLDILFQLSWSILGHFSTNINVGQSQHLAKVTVGQNKRLARQPFHKSDQQ